MAIEPRRGCGFRKVGGLYLCSDGESSPCCRLPIPLDVCPTCGHGIKQTRGFTWIDPGELLSTAPGPFCIDEIGARVDVLQRGYPLLCPLKDPGRWMRRTCDCDEPPAPHADECASLEPARAGLLWIGEQYYSTVGDFLAEADELGISRRIPALPRGFVVGETWVLLAHPKAIAEQTSIFDGGPRPGQKPGPGIFRVFRPSRLEKIVDATTPDDELEKLRKRGITPVVVPADDPDHH